jgi:hypothetical protein
MYLLVPGILDLSIKFGTVLLTPPHPFYTFGTIPKSASTKNKGTATSATDISAHMIPILFPVAVSPSLVSSNPAASLSLVIANGPTIPHDPDPPSRCPNISTVVLKPTFL